MKKAYLILFVLAALAFGLFFMFRASPQTSSVPPSETIGEEPTTTATPGATVFDVTGRNYAFDPAEIRVKAGDTMRINFKSENGFHDFQIDEFTGAKTEVLSTGKTQTIEFVADKIGTFEYYCGVGNHRAMGMVGKFIVE